LIVTAISLQLLTFLPFYDLKRKTYWNKGQLIFDDYQLSCAIRVFSYTTNNRLNIITKDCQAPFLSKHIKIGGIQIRKNIVSLDNQNPEEITNKLIIYAV
jgi:hypothetical protein